MLIRDQLVASTKNISTAPNAKRSVTVHQTGNTGRGANAAAHANLQSRPNPRVASWNWTVDDTEAVRSFPHTVRTFHAGTARGNRESISVEICVNLDGDYTQAVRNGATLVARILREEGLGVGDVVQHYYWTRKDCPTQIRASLAGIGWATFLTLVSAALNGSGEPVKPSPGLPRYHPVTNAQLEQLALLGFYDGRIDATPGPMSHAAIVAFQAAHWLVQDGVLGPITTTRLTKEYEAMTQQILDAIAASEQRTKEFVDTRIDQLAAWRPTIDAALREWQADGAPDGVGKQVSQLFTKLARLDLQEVHFRLASDGPWCVAWIGTGTWAICPDDDTWTRHHGVLDHLRLTGTRAIATWEEISGAAASVVAQPLAFGTEVAWHRQEPPAGEVPSEVAPLVEG